MGKTSVKNIELEISGKTIKLTVKEARELREILVDLFPEKTYFSPKPVTVPSTPYSRPWREYRKCIPGGYSVKPITTGAT